MSRPETPDDTLWAFEQQGRKYVYVTDINWTKRKVIYTAYDQHHVASEGEMVIEAFSIWVGRQDVHEVPI